MMSGIHQSLLWGISLISHNTCSVHLGCQRWYQQMVFSSIFWYSVSRAVRLIMSKWAPQVVTLMPEQLHLSSIFPLSAYSSSCGLPSTGDLHRSTWLGLGEMVSEKLVPTAMDKDPVPENLLNVICCSCKVDSWNCGGTDLCLCKKGGRVRTIPRKANTQ